MSNLYATRGSDNIMAVAMAVLRADFKYYKVIIINLERL